MNARRDGRHAAPARHARVLTCLDGRVVIFVAGDRYLLEPGDVLGFLGNVKHSYQNPDPERAARGLSVVVFAKSDVQLG